MLVNHISRPTLRRSAAVATCTAIAVLGTVTAQSAAAQTATSAKPAACKQWKISGKWTSGQPNTGQVFYTFAQHKTALHGTATLPKSEAADTGFAHGKLTGTLKGVKIHYVVVWDRSTKDGTVHRGDYKGTVSAGKMVGHSYDLTDPNSTSNFDAHGHTSCVRR